jgi:hypothetical protein
MATLWGDRRFGAISATDIEALQRDAVATAVSRRDNRGGRHAGEHVIAAARAFFVRAVADELITAAASPARQIAKRPPSRCPISHPAGTVCLDAQTLTIITFTPAGQCRSNPRGPSWRVDTGFCLP